MDAAFTLWVKKHKSKCSTETNCHDGLAHQLYSSLGLWQDPFVANCGIHDECHLYKTLGTETQENETEGHFPEGTVLHRNRIKVTLTFLLDNRLNKSRHNLKQVKQHEQKC